jgi:hypothetical protein
LSKLKSMRLSENFAIGGTWDFLIGGECFGAWPGLEG